MGKIATFGAKWYKTSIASANEIGNLIGIGELDFTRAETDSTTHDDAWKTKLMGLWDAGTITFRIAFDQQVTNHAAIVTTDVMASTPHTAHPTWVFTVKSNPTGTKKASYSFSGAIQSFKLMGYEVEGMQVAEVTMSVSGAPTVNNDDTTTP